MTSYHILHMVILRQTHGHLRQVKIVKLTEFGPKFLLNSLFISFFLFSLLVSTLGTRDGVWHNMTFTQSWVTGHSHSNGHKLQGGKKKDVEDSGEDDIILHG